MTGSRHYSKDLLQGGLEILCVLTSQGSAKEIAKAEKLIRSTLVSDSQITKPSVQHGSDSPQSENRKLNVPGEYKIGTQELDPQRILDGEKLSEQHIHQAQFLIKSQFPQLNGLQLTLLHAVKTIQT